MSPNDILLNSSDKRYDKKKEVCTHDIEVPEKLKTKKT